MRSPLRNLLLAPLLTGAILACSEQPRERVVRLSFDEPAPPGPSIILRADTVRGRRGERTVDVHALLPATGTEASARATLQHLIDSVAAADTLVVAVRAVGFLMGRVDSATMAADLEPAITAAWGPPDSAWAFGAGRRAYRTHFTILRPIGAAGGTRAR